MAKKTRIPELVVGKIFIDGGKGSNVYTLDVDDSDDGVLRIGNNNNLSIATINQRTGELEAGSFTGDGKNLTNLTAQEQAELEAAKLVTIHADNLFFKFTPDDLAKDETQKITIKAQTQNIDGPVFTYSSDQIVLDTWTAEGVLEIDISDFEDLGGTPLEYATITLSEASVDLKDSITLYKIQDGATGRDAIQVALTNPAHNYAAPSTGLLDAASLESGKTDIVVYYGGTKVQASEGVGTFPYFTATAYSEGAIENVNYSDSTDVGNHNDGFVEFPTTNHINAGTGGDMEIAAPVDVHADAATIIFTVKVYIKDGEDPFVLEAVQSFTKSKTGATGTDSKSVKISADDYQFAYNEHGKKAVGGDSGDYIVLTAAPQNHGESVTVLYRWFVDEVPWMPGDFELGGAPDGGGEALANPNEHHFQTENVIRVYPETLYEDFTGGSKVIRVETAETAIGTMIASDEQPVIATKDGSDAVRIIMNNPAHAFPQTNTGNTDYDDGDCTMWVYFGNDQLKVDDTAQDDINARIITDTMAYVDIPSLMSSMDDASFFVIPNATDAGSNTDSINPGTGTYINETVGDATTGEITFNPTAMHTGLSKAGIVYNFYIKDKTGEISTANQTQTFTRTTDGSDGEDGETGANARAIKLTFDDYQIAFDEHGGNPETTAGDGTITFTATPQGYANNLLCRFYIDTALQDVPTGAADKDAAWALDGNWFRITDEVNDICQLVKDFSGETTATFGKKKTIKVETMDVQIGQVNGDWVVTELNTDTEDPLDTLTWNDVKDRGIAAIDSETIIATTAGSNALAVHADNLNHGFLSSYDGELTNGHTGGGCNFTAYIGNQQLVPKSVTQFEAVTAETVDDGVFTVEVTAETSIDADTSPLAHTGDKNFKYGEPSGFPKTENQASIEFKLRAKDSTGTERDPLILVQSFTKSKAGASAPMIRLDASSYAFVFQDEDAYEPIPESITYTITNSNLAEAITVDNIKFLMGDGTDNSTFIKNWKPDLENDGVDEGSPTVGEKITTSLEAGSGDSFQLELKDFSGLICDGGINAVGPFSYSNFIKDGTGVDARRYLKTVLPTTVQVSYTTTENDEVAGITLSDSVPLMSLDGGSDAIQVRAPNGTHIFNADADGLVGSDFYASSVSDFEHDSGTDILAFQGATQLVHNTDDSTLSSYRLGTPILETPLGDDVDGGDGNMVTININTDKDKINISSISEGFTSQVITIPVSITKKDGTIVEEGVHDIKLYYSKTYDGRDGTDPYNFDFSKGFTGWSLDETHLDGAVAPSLFSLRNAFTPYAEEDVSFEMYEPGGDPFDDGGSGASSWTSARKATNGALVGVFRDYAADNISEVVWMGSPVHHSDGNGYQATLRLKANHFQEEQKILDGAPVIATNDIKTTKAFVTMHVAGFDSLGNTTKRIAEFSKFADLDSTSDAGAWGLHHTCTGFAEEEKSPTEHKPGLNAQLLPFRRNCFDNFKVEWGEIALAEHFPDAVSFKVGFEIRYLDKTTGDPISLDITYDDEAWVDLFALYGDGRYRDTFNQCHQDTEAPSSPPPPLEMILNGNLRTLESNGLPENVQFGLYDHFTTYKADAHDGSLFPNLATEDKWKESKIKLYYKYAEYANGSIKNRKSTLTHRAEKYLKFNNNGQDDTNTVTLIPRRQYKKSHIYHVDGTPFTSDPIASRPRTSMIFHAAKIPTASKRIKIKYRYKTKWLAMNASEFEELDDKAPHMRVMFHENKKSTANYIASSDVNWRHTPSTAGNGFPITDNLSYRQSARIEMDYRGAFGDYAQSNPLYPDSFVPGTNVYVRAPLNFAVLGGAAGLEDVYAPSYIDSDVADELEWNAVEGETLWTTDTLIIDTATGKYHHFRKLLTEQLISPAAGEQITNWSEISSTEDPIHFSFQVWSGQDVSDSFPGKLHGTVDGKDYYMPANQAEITLDYVTAEIVEPFKLGDWDSDADAKVELGAAAHTAVAGVDITWNNDGEMTIDFGGMASATSDVASLNSKISIDNDGNLVGAGGGGVFDGGTTGAGVQSNASLGATAHAGISVAEVEVNGAGEFVLNFGANFGAVQSDFSANNANAFDNGTVGAGVKADGIKGRVAHTGMENANISDNVGGGFRIGFGDGSGGEWTGVTYPFKIKNSEISINETTGKMEGIATEGVSVDNENAFDDGSAGEGVKNDAADGKKAHDGLFTAGTTNWGTDGVKLQFGGSAYTDIEFGGVKNTGITIDAVGEMLGIGTSGKIVDNEQVFLHPTWLALAGHQVFTVNLETLKKVKIVSDSLVFKYDGEGTASPSSQTITMTADTQNVDGGVVWTAEDQDGGSIVLGSPEEEFGKEIFSSLSGVANGQKGASTWDTAGEWTNGGPDMTVVSDGTHSTPQLGRKFLKGAGDYSESSGYTIGNNTNYSPGDTVEGDEFLYAGLRDSSSTYHQENDWWTIRRTVSAEDAAAITSFQFYYYLISRTDSGDVDTLPEVKVQVWVKRSGEDWAQINISPDISGAGGQPVLELNASDHGTTATGNGSTIWTVNGEKEWRRAACHNLDTGSGEFEIMVSAFTEYCDLGCVLLDKLFFTKSFEKTLSISDFGASESVAIGATVDGVSDSIKIVRVSDGTDGTDGTDGDSAYQVWLDEGNSGSEQDFLDSLKGGTGDDGKSFSAEIDRPIVYKTSAGGTLTANNNATARTITMQQDGFTNPEFYLFKNGVEVQNWITSTTYSIAWTDFPAGNTADVYKVMVREGSSGPSVLSSVVSLTAMIVADDGEDGANGEDGTSASSNNFDMMSGPTGWHQRNWNTSTAPPEATQDRTVGMLHTSPTYMASNAAHWSPSLGFMGTSAASGENWIAWCVEKIPIAEGYDGVAMRAKWFNGDAKGLNIVLQYYDATGAKVGLSNMPRLSDTSLSTTVRESTGEFKVWSSNSTSRINPIDNTFFQVTAAFSTDTTVVPTTAVSYKIGWYVWNSDIGNDSGATWRSNANYTLVIDYFGPYRFTPNQLIGTGNPPGGGLIIVP